MGCALKQQLSSRGVLVACSCSRAIVHGLQDTCSHWLTPKRSQSVCE